MADEYIRRDAAMKAVASQYGACRSPAQNRMIDEIRNKIRRMPAADVAPVRHGRWIHTDLAAHWYGKDECNECTYHEHDRKDLSHFNYCPGCGAKMDGAAE